jgi:hypothetical protein
MNLDLFECVYISLRRTLEIVHLQDLQTSNYDFDYLCSQRMY